MPKSADTEIGKQLLKHRKFILWSEIAALLHDIGKLSSNFLEYRLTWHALENGYTEKDPHEHAFFHRHDSLLANLDTRREFMQFCEMIYAQPELHNAGPAELPWITIEEAVHYHAEPISNISKLLKIADAKDASIDRNNPLFSSEQTDRNINDAATIKAQNPVFRVYPSNVFGFEKPGGITGPQLDNERKQLYSFLQDHLPNFKKKFESLERDRIREAIKSHLRIGLADTTRPDNDTSLWDHSEGVAVMFKTFLAHAAIYGRIIDTFEDANFGIWGLGWNSFSFLSRSQKISDVQARRELIKDIQKAIRNKIECQFALGNAIYRDDDGIYFLIPSSEVAGSMGTEVEKCNLSCRNNEYRKFLDVLEAEIHAECADLSAGELLPSGFHVRSTPFVTAIVKAIEGVRSAASAPYSSNADPAVTHFLNAWKNSSGKSDVCGICGKRPAAADSAPDRAKVCGVCEARRISAQSPANKENGQTVFQGELEDRNGRICLILARFGLTHWLNGEMVRSLFVTPAHTLTEEVRQLGLPTEFQEQEDKCKAILNDGRAYSYSRILDEIKLCYSIPDKSDDRCKLAESALFLFGRRFRGIKDRKLQLNSDLGKTSKEWAAFLDSARREHFKPERFYDSELDDWLLPNILCGKTPTPSTILDIWNTTESFFRGITSKDTAIASISGLENKPRIQLKVNQNFYNFQKNLIHEGRVAPEGSKIEFLPLENDTLLLVDGTPFKDEANRPLREKWKNMDIHDIRLPEGKIIEGEMQIIEVTQSDRFYKAYRVISQSPNSFMMLAPAQKALTIAQDIT